MSNRWLHSSGGDTGKNCDRVRMARVRTAGRECIRSGAMAVRGCGFVRGSEKWAGKRVIRMDSVDSVSIRVSGGVSGCR